MFTPSKWHTRQFILCCSILFLAAGCGLSEMFSGSNAEKITEPCIELIPSATPTPMPTVVPIIPITPIPGKTPTPSQSCGNAPGIVLICDGEPVEETPITVITPPPSVVYYTITAADNNPTCGGSVSPLGSISIQQGATATFTISFGSCMSVTAYLDGFLYSSATYLDPPPVTISIPNVNANHSILFTF